MESKKGHRIDEVNLSLTDARTRIPNVEMTRGNLAPAHVATPLDITGVFLTQINVGARKRPLNDAVVQTLVEDIKKQGLLQPIGVRASKGNRGGPFTLIYGQHRLEAYRKIFETDPRADSIPAIVYPSDTPDWQIEIAEISENLCRKELTTEERDSHTLLLAAALKRYGLVAPSDQKKVEAGKAGGVASGKARGLARSTGTSGPSASTKAAISVDPVGSKPTVAQALSDKLGVDKKTVQRRFNRAAEAAGATDATLETATADQLDDIAQKATKATKESKTKTASLPAVRTKKSDADPDAFLTDAQMTSLELGILLLSLDTAFKFGGAKFVCGAFENWKRKKGIK